MSLRSRWTAKNDIFPLKLKIRKQRVKYFKFDTQNELLNVKKTIFSTYGYNWKDHWGPVEGSKEIEVRKSDKIKISRDWQNVVSCRKLAGKKLTKNATSYRSIGWSSIDWFENIIIFNLFARTALKSICFALWKKYEKFFRSKLAKKIRRTIIWDMIDREPIVVFIKTLINLTNRRREYQTWRDET